jgi:hypothetical protein
MKQCYHCGLIGPSPICFNCGNANIHGPDVDPGPLTGIEGVIVLILTVTVIVIMKLVYNCHLDK